MRPPAQPRTMLRPALRHDDHPLAVTVEWLQVVRAVELQPREARALQQQLQLVAADVAEGEGRGGPLDRAVGAQAVVEEDRLDALLGGVERAADELIDAV